MLNEDKIRKYLQVVKDIKLSYELIDIHVHPTEIIYNNLNYYQNQNNQGLYSRVNSKYVPPRIENTRLKEKNSTENSINDRLKNKIYSIMINNLYNHIGPKVMEDHMKISGVDRILLLPVAPSKGMVDNQMTIMNEMYGNDDRFLFAYCVPNTVDENNICNSIKAAINIYDIKAIKLHPNITEIDLTSNIGIHRVEAILSACNDLDLPLVVHSGKSPILENKDASEYSTINNLEKVDWSISTETVVIAHAGTYGHEPEEVENNILPKINKMLNRYDNLMVDISGIGSNILIQILKNVDHNRILFGSDALYNVQWSSIVVLLNAIEKVYKKIEDYFLQIVSLNPSKHVLKEVKIK